MDVRAGRDLRRSDLMEEAVDRRRSRGGIGD